MTERIPPFDRRSEKHTDGARPKYLVVGIDSEGAHHVIRNRPTAADRVYVIEDTEITHSFAIGTYEKWMGHVADARGWADRYYESEPFAGLEASA